uniref:Uncharacterized protein n=1 Tax=Parascaris equorum TaxID=6256 RepID=A0A914RIA7_PAREQ
MFIQIAFFYAFIDCTQYIFIEVHKFSVIAAKMLLIRHRLIARNGYTYA